MLSVAMLNVVPNGILLHVIMLSVVNLNVTMLHDIMASIIVMYTTMLSVQRHSDWHFASCQYAECHGACIMSMGSTSLLGILTLFTFLSGDSNFRQQRKENLKSPKSKRTFVFRRQTTDGPIF